MSVGDQVVFVSACQLNFISSLVHLVFLNSFTVVRIKCSLNASANQMCSHLWESIGSHCNGISTKHVVLFSDYIFMICNYIRRLSNWGRSYRRGGCQASDHSSRLCFNISTCFTGSCTSLRREKVILVTRSRDISVVSVVTKIVGFDKSFGWFQIMIVVKKTGHF